MGQVPEVATDTKGFRWRNPQKKRDFAINALQRGEIFQNMRDVFAIDREDEKLLRRRMKECVALTQTKSMPRIVFIETPQGNI